MRVFVDSDVVISSFLSATGAAYFLLTQSQIKPVISSFSLKEIKTVAKRMGIQPEILAELIKERFELFKITQKLKEIQQEYGNFVTDAGDAHIVAGAHGANVKYLISYNLKDFKTDKIKDKLDIVIMTPALFLQYIRSQ